MNKLLLKTIMIFVFVLPAANSWASRCDTLPKNRAIYQLVTWCLEDAIGLMFPVADGAEPNYEKARDGFHKILRITKGPWHARTEAKFYLLLMAYEGRITAEQREIDAKRYPDIIKKAQASKSSSNPEWDKDWYMSLVGVLREKRSIMNGELTLEITEATWNRMEQFLKRDDQPKELKK